MKVQKYIFFFYSMYILRIFASLKPSLMRYSYITPPKSS